MAVIPKMTKDNTRNADAAIKMRITRGSILLIKLIFRFIGAVSLRLSIFCEDLTFAFRLTIDDFILNSNEPLLTEDRLLVFLRAIKGILIC